MIRPRALPVACILSLAPALLSSAIRPAAVAPVEPVSLALRDVSAADDPKYLAPFPLLLVDMTAEYFEDPVGPVLVPALAAAPSPPVVELGGLPSAPRPPLSPPLLFVEFWPTSWSQGGWPYTPSGPIPEPSTWALMIAGFVALGAIIRRRKQKT